MKKVCSRLLGTVVVILMCVSGNVNSATIAFTTAGSLNVRDRPDGQVVDTLPMGSVVAISKKYEGWAAILYFHDSDPNNAKSGWVSSKFLKLRGTAPSGVAGAICETEYDTGAEVCLTVTNTDFDCNESYAGNYYSECELEVDYELQTDYRGNSSLDVNVECDAEVSYKARESYDSYESEYDSSNHSLYSNSSDYGSIDLDFSFSSYQEVYEVEVDSVDCEISSVELY